jgi:hypothetical protein
MREYYLHSFQIDSLHTTQYSLGQLDSILKWAFVYFPKKKEAESR